MCVNENTWPTKASASHSGSAAASGSTSHESVTRITPWRGSSSRLWRRSHHQSAPPTLAIARPEKA